MNETALTAEQKKRLAERQARENRELTPEEVLRRNSVERIKNGKPPATLAGEFSRLASTPSVAVAEEDILLLQWHGLYHDKPKAGSFMMRIKVPNGILKSAQLRTVGELAVRHGNNQVEITTRQDLQIHGIRLETMQEAFATLQRAGLSTRAGCGDTLRNITGCPVAGLDAEELFDTTPLVLEAHRRFSGNPQYDNLPRKHKWTISACPYHCNAPEIHDVALVGTMQDGQSGFAVWVGGGMSSAPRLARNLGVFVTPAESLDVAQALLDEWMGDLRYRTTRSKARFKFMVDDLGPQVLRARVEQRLARRLTDLRENPRPEGRTDHLGIHQQAESNLYYVGFPVLAGILNGEQLIKIAEIVEGCCDDVRLTRQQNLIVTGVPSCGVNEVVEVLEQEAGLSLKTNFLRGHSLACTGHPHCNFSVGETKRKLIELVEHLEQQFGPAAGDLHLHLDGCPHACCQHWVGDIGIQGTTLTTPAGKIQAYDLFLRGGLGTEAQIGKALFRRVPTDDLKFYVERLVRAYFSERQNGEPIQGYFARHNDEELGAIARGSSATAAPATT